MGLLPISVGTCRLVNAISDDRGRAAIGLEIATGKRASHTYDRPDAGAPQCGHANITINPLIVIPRPSAAATASGSWRLAVSCPLSLLER